MMQELINDFNQAGIFLFVFVSVWCLLLASIDTSVSYNQSQYVHVDSGTKKKRQYYFCYCKNGRKDMVTHIIEVSENTFNNVTTYHDASEIIHIGRNKVYLDSNKSGSSFNRLPDVR